MNDYTDTAIIIAATYQWRRVAHLLNTGTMRNFPPDGYLDPPTREQLDTLAQRVDQAITEEMKTCENWVCAADLEIESQVVGHFGIVARIEKDQAMPKTSAIRKWIRTLCEN